MTEYDFAPRKSIRKAKKDGIKNLLVSSVEHATRNYFGKYILNYLLKNNIVTTISRKELHQDAKQNYFQLKNPNEPLPFISVIENGRIFLESGLIMTEDFKIIEESVGGTSKTQRKILAALSRQLFYSGFYIKKLPFGPDSVSADELGIAGPVVAPSKIYPNYFHWMIGSAPQIQYIQAYENHFDKEVTILIPAGVPSFVDETLNLLNCPSSSIRRLKRPVHDVEEVLVPSYTGHQHRDFNWLANTIMENTGDKNEYSGDVDQNDQNNIYISRANAIERRVVNEEEVVDMLSDYGFLCYSLEERTVAENACLFNNADVIVGPHGAGLTDMIFSDDATVIELFGYQSVQQKPVYRRLADTVGVNYKCLHCDHDSVDIIVDVDQLEEQVINALNR